MTAENKPKKGKKTWKIVRTILIILVVVVGVLYYVQYRQQQTALESLNDLELVAFGRETLTSSINGTGTVQPNQDALLFWETSGTVGNIEVKVGDEVSKDALIMRLDENNLPLDIMQARMEKMTAEQSLADLDENTALRRAQLGADIANAEKTLKVLQQELQLLEDRECTEWRLNNLQSKYDDALEAYQDVPNELNLNKVKLAQTDLDFCRSEAIDQLINEKQSQIDLQNENIQSWQDALDKIKNGPDPDEKEKLALQLEIAEKRLSTSEIRAPFGGMITALYSNAGDLVSVGTQAVHVSDLSRLFVETPISEVDIPNVRVGQKAELVFDAYFEDTYTGVVTEVSKVGTAQQGVINYMVTIEIENGSETLKPGMTAGVTIIVEEKPNVLVAPGEAITSKDGKDVLYVLRDGLPVAVEVKIGAYSNQQVEILEGDIEEGEMIVLNPPTSILDALSSPVLNSR
ncbi:MAG: efflux RND transporter periplasmic adaptor subunit [Anaerolineaceae bacterium]